MWSWLLLRLPLVPSCCADWIAEWQKTPCAANPRVEVLSMVDNSTNNTLKITFMKTLRELANRVIMSQNIESLCFQRQPQFHRILSSRWGQQTCKMPGCRRRCWAATRWIFLLTTGVPGWNKIQHMLLAWCCGYKTARTHCTKRLTNPSQGTRANARNDHASYPFMTATATCKCIQRCMASHMRDSWLSGSVSNHARLTKRLSVRNWQKRGR